MTKVFFISKINLASHHIFDVYSKDKSIRDILKIIMTNIDDKKHYERRDFVKRDGKETLNYWADYEFSSLEKKDDYIVGKLIKSADLTYNKKDDDSTELVKKHQVFSEAIPFYFDVFNELIVFFTRKRFKHVEFNFAFEKLIELHMNIKNDENYKFNVSTVQSATTISEIKEELLRVGKVKCLKLSFRPPNPKETLLDEIEENIEEYLEDFKEGNITETSTLFNSTSPEGINIKSDIIDDEFNKINKIHSKLSEEEAFKNNYVVVEAETKSGRRYSTKDRKPITTKVEVSYTYGSGFKCAAKDMISDVINKHTNDK